MKRKLSWLGLAALTLLVLTACGRGAIDAQTSGLWGQFVYFFAQMIRAFSINGVIGTGIILFTLFLRLLLIPVYNLQIKSSQKMQEVQPLIKEVQAKYPGKDMESRVAMNEEVQALYKAHNVNPFTNFIPLFIQLPILFGLYQALIRVAFLQEGSFLWFEIAKPDPYLILPVFAASFTFLATYLSNKAMKEKNTMMTIMMLAMPAMIFLFGLSMASGVALYWTVSNVCQVAQILLFNNPYKIIEAREAEALLIKEKEAKKRKAMKKAQKRR